MNDQDPRHHLLSTRRYDWDEQGAPVSFPVTFAEEAAECRESLAGASGDRYIRITGLHALLGAALLKELAARLQRDVERGEIDPDAEQLADVATELVKIMHEAAGLS